MGERYLPRAFWLKSFDGAIKTPCVLIEISLKALVLLCDIMESQEWLFVGVLVAPEVSAQLCVMCWFDKFSLLSSEDEYVRNDILAFCPKFPFRMLCF